jgi:hypothetical protein
LLPFERTTFPAPGGQLEECKLRISSHEHVLRWGLEENAVEDNARIRVLSAVSRDTANDFVL